MRLLSRRGIISERLFQNISLYGALLAIELCCWWKSWILLIMSYIIVEERILGTGIIEKICASKEWKIFLKSFGLLVSFRWYILIAFVYGITLILVTVCITRLNTSTASSMLSLRSRFLMISDLWWIIHWLVMSSVTWTTTINLRYYPWYFVTIISVCSGVIVIVKKFLISTHLRRSRSINMWIKNRFNNGAVNCVINFIFLNIRVHPIVI